MSSTALYPGNNPYVPPHPQYVQTQTQQSHSRLATANITNSSGAQGSSSPLYTNGLSSSAVNTVAQAAHQAAHGTVNAQAQYVAKVTIPGTGTPDGFYIGLEANATNLGSGVKSEWTDYVQPLSDIPSYPSTAKGHSTVIPLSTLPRATSTSAPRLGHYEMPSPHDQSADENSPSPSLSSPTTLLPVSHPLCPQAPLVPWASLSFGVRWAIVRAFRHVNHPFMFIAIQLLHLSQNDITCFILEINYECAAWKRACLWGKAGKAVWATLLKNPGVPASSKDIVDERHFQSIEGLAKEDIDLAIQFLLRVGLHEPMMEHVATELRALENIYSCHFNAVNIPWAILEEADRTPQEEHSDFGFKEGTAETQTVDGSFVGTFVETYRKPGVTQDLESPQYLAFLQGIRDSGSLEGSGGPSQPFILESANKYKVIAPPGVTKYLEMPELSEAPPPRRTYPSAPPSSSTSGGTRLVAQPTAQATGSEMTMTGALGGQPVPATNGNGTVDGSATASTGNGAHQPQTDITDDILHEFPLTESTEFVEAIMLSRGHVPYVQTADLPTFPVRPPIEISQPLDVSSYSNWDFGGEAIELFAEVSDSTSEPEPSLKRKLSKRPDSSNKRVAAP
ncbi:hypothetical protein B0I35DRAFT_475961 [Stachybotrys elegans]|uniref:Uncharacterized protein n=1 Tax=Stachybotrys elegans TaxID=80388 RepID=A0A8K0WUH8_9HYPO|nr:hypothetical protein B0I35DRAFT_475961 [Stachybotrys elegans]